MKKTLYIVMIAGTLHAQSHVILAPITPPLCKAARCTWHLTRIAVALPQFEHARWVVAHYDWMSPEKKRFYRINGFIVFMGGLASLQSGIMGLKNEFRRSAPIRE